MGFQIVLFHPRIQDGVCDPAQSTATDRQKETDLDEDEKDLNTKKVRKVFAHIVHVLIQELQVNFTALM